MWVTATVALTTRDGETALYQVGSDVDFEASGPMCGYDVGEPDVSAADCSLASSRIVDTDTLERGWSELASEVLVEAYGAALEDAKDSQSDYYEDAEDRGYDGFYELDDNRDEAD